MKTSFEALNMILKGEHVAIQQYQAYIDTLTDSPLRNHLTAILTDHKEHATRIAYYIQTNGGQAEEGAGISGTMAEWKTRLSNLRETAPTAMLERLYDGENKGLSRAEKYSEQYLDSAQKEVLNPIFADEHEHLKQLQDLRDGLYNNI